MFSTDFPNESVEIFKYFSSQKKLKFSNLTILNKQTKNIYSFFYDKLFNHRIHEKMTVSFKDNLMRSYFVFPLLKA